MLIYSDSFYVADNGNGYSLNKRDAICSKCHKVVGRQEKYDVFDTEFKFKIDDCEKKDWRFCPFCGKPLYDNK
jgi:hypothetical protein